MDDNSFLHEMKRLGVSPLRRGEDGSGVESSCAFSVGVRAREEEQKQEREEEQKQEREEEQKQETHDDGVPLLLLRQESHVGSEVFIGDSPVFAGGSACALSGSGRFAGMALKHQKRFCAGAYTIEARLDLHGSNVQQAYARFSSFIARARERGLRCVCVITGTGDLRYGGGILRRSLHLWVHTHRERIVACCPAQPKDGGKGAFYLYLRKKRNRPASSPRNHTALTDSATTPPKR